MSETVSSLPSWFLVSLVVQSGGATSQSHILGQVHKETEGLLTTRHRRTRSKSTLDDRADGQWGDFSVLFSINRAMLSPALAQ